MKNCCIIYAAGMYSKRTHITTTDILLFQVNQMINSFAYLGSLEALYDL